MAATVAMLEDDVYRISAMRACLAQSLPEMELVIFDHAQRMIAWLEDHLGAVVLISLDHDLPLRHEAGRSIDCGTGRQVADYLAAHPPTCPVIVHSSNNDGAAGMFFALKDAGWPCCRVYPSDGETWIRNAWHPAVREYLENRWIA
jgi:DNA-binding NarL/FixJ family response regulator